MAQEFTNYFLRDTDELLNILTSGTELVDMSRALHSLKSAASFLGWDDLEQEAHVLEESLASPRKDEMNWKEAAEGLKRIIEQHRDQSRPTDSKSKVGRVQFSDLERSILVESRRRGESFYRLGCSIDSSESLPYSRAYLLASKLETGMTLVKTHPSMDDTEADFSRLSFWFTTDKPESDIFSSANVDLVTSVKLVQLNYNDLLSMDAVPVCGSMDDEREENTPLIIDRSNYTEAMQVAEELAWRLEKNPGTPEATLSQELQRSLESLAFQSVEPLLMEIGEAVSRLAGRRGLKARFEWSTSTGGLEISTLEILGEILRQLVRNSLRHGIESPEDRRLSGKSETGVLKFHLERTGSFCRFRFEDDGKGIDEEAVIERAEREGLLTGYSKDSRPNLLEILRIPGFSTLEEADYDGGRGMGLELVWNILNREFGSELELENIPGGGLALHWSLPEKHLKRPYLVFSADDRTWAIPSNSIHRRGVMDASRVNASGQGYRTGGGVIPLVGPTGLRLPGTIMPYYLEIHHRGRRAALLVDDLISEEPWGSDELVPADPAGTWCRALKDRKEGIPILSPTLVYATE